MCSMHVQQIQLNPPNLIEFFLQRTAFYWFELRIESLVVGPNENSSYERYSGREYGEKKVKIKQESCEHGMLISLSLSLSKALSFSSK